MAKPATVGPCADSAMACGPVSEVTVAPALLKLLLCGLLLWCRSALLANGGRPASAHVVTAHVTPVTRPGARHGMRQRLLDSAAFLTIGGVQPPCMEIKRQFGPWLTAGEDACVYLQRRSSLQPRAPPQKICHDNCIRVRRCFPCYRGWATATLCAHTSQLQPYVRVCKIAPAVINNRDKVPASRRCR